MLTDIVLTQQIARVYAKLVKEVMGSNVDEVVLVSAQAVEWSDVRSKEITTVKNH